MNGINDVLGTVEAKHHHLIRLARGRKGLVRAHGHCIIAAKDGINLRMSLQNRFKNFHCLCPIELGRLLRNHLQFRIVVDDAVKTF